MDKHDIKIARSYLNKLTFFFRYSECNFQKVGSIGYPCTLSYNYVMTQYKYDFIFTKYTPSE